MENKITVTVSKLAATCLQRMIVGEIDNQKWWMTEDESVGTGEVDSVRYQIISEMQKLANELESQGIHKYVK